MMDDILDIIWFKIIDGTLWLVALMNQVLAPLHVLGPAGVILLLAFITVCVTKVFSRFYTTRRYRELKKDFEYWFNLRQEALNCTDPEKGKALAKNIDQAKLNKVYYDFFFEGFLNNILTTYLPILLMAAYVNESYQPDNLLKHFGRPYVFTFTGSSGEPMAIGAVFWFVSLLVLIYTFWFILQRMLRRKKL